MANSILQDWLFGSAGQCFPDRATAGQALADQLHTYATDPNLIILALPRGGVPVAFEVARRLGAALDILLVRKLGVPGREELAMGAIAEGGMCVLNRELIDELGIAPKAIERIMADETQELARRAQVYRGNRPMHNLSGQTVILIDDGLATGTTMHAAIATAQAQNPARLVVAVPVAAPQTIAEIRPLVDDLIAVEMPEPFHAIGLWYKNFTQISDQEVCSLLKQASERPELKPSHP